jgi:hypothetical protein
MKLAAKLTIVVCALALLAACGGGSEKAETKTDSPVAAAVSATSTSQPTLAVAAASTPAPGKPVTLTLTLTGADGKPLGPNEIKTEHEHKVHVMIVDSALEDYSHVHGEPGAKPGEWTVSFTPKHPREYRVWADFKLAGGEHEGHGDAHSEGREQEKKDGHGEKGHSHEEGGHDQGKTDDHGLTPSATLGVGGETGPAIAAVQSLSAKVDGYAFTLSLGGALTADAHVPATLTVADSAGAPVAALEPLMGAYAHLVGFSADGTTMVHGHPEGAEPKDASARGGPALTFELHPTASGPNRMFVQVKIGGKVITAPFTLVVG